MGRTLPTECPHGAIIDWGDFGCQEPECYGTCDINPPEPCEVCFPADEPVPYVLVQDAEERRRLSTTASDGQTCMIYRGGVA